ncbi:MAG: LysM peptidoglycan-binding domain-containing protein, partial [Acidimicrobiales bacterium]|nr:LysM peptidoglycan-binding domain-containing protein [Acidimicrobiales bacterium]
MARLARAALAGLTLVALVIGLPVLLARYGSWPIHGVPTADQLSDAPGQALTDDAVFAILTVAAWATWAAFTVSVGLELVAAVRGASRPTLPYLGPIQHGARQLVASFLMTATLTGPFASQRVVAAPALPPLSEVTRQPVAAVIHDEPPPRAPVDVQPVKAATPTEDLPVVRVARGDSPWSLAERHLGDGLRWRELWDLNRGIAQADGRAWVVEDQIDIGWQIRLPTDAVEVPAPGTAEPTNGGGPAEDTGEHVVLPGDTLREIAETELGDSERYPEIFEASQTIDQPGGARLTDPDLILPGWTLRLPATSSAPAESDAPTAPADIPHPNGSAPSTTTTTGPPPTTDPPNTETSVTTTAPAPPTSAAEQTPPSATAVAGSDDAGSDDLAPDESDETESTPTALLSALGTALAGITGATVLATGLAALIRHRRRRGPARARTRRPADTELAVVRASDVPLVRWAGQSLGAMAAHIDPRRIDGVPVAVELNDQTGIELLWDSPQPDPPEPWHVAAGGWAWRLPYDPDAPVPADEYPSPLPALVTVGRRDGRQLLVNLEALGSLAICGDETIASALVQAIVAELATSEDLADSYLTVAGVEAGPADGLDRVERATVDEALDQLAAADRSVADLLGGDATTTFAVRCGARGTHVEASVFIVDGSLAPGEDGIDDALAASHPHHGTALVVLGDAPGAAARLTVSRDGSAHLAPLGIDFEAAGLPPETSDLLRQLLEVEAEDDAALTTSDADSEAEPSGLTGSHATAESTPPASRPTDPREAALVGRAVIDLRVVDHPLTEPDPPAATPQLSGNGHAAVTAGVNGDRQHQDDTEEEHECVDDVGRARDARLLVHRPRLLVKVLGRPHVPDRPDLGRRETVLAAYLACHDGPSTTSGVQDAIWNGRAVESKTLWNLIARTRRALGTFDDGTPVMPQADRIKGTITLGPGAVSDLAVLRTSYERAVGSSSAEAVPLLRDALDLVEGPPFDAPGY